tara:strand:- start:2228 stop:5179 length:2952 start_codon:yes stop_codon:yes gene_type:complete
MANIRKSFNFRAGVQVDEDNFVVDSLGKVGIGTTVPEQFLDVRGRSKIVGLLTVTSIETENIKSVGIATFNKIEVGNAIIANAETGDLTATKFVGDGSSLTGMSESQWVDIDVGLGFTSIYNTGFVGISTSDPRFTLQIGGNNALGSFQNGVGINSAGGIVATGVVTATTFKGNLEGNVTGDITGNLRGSTLNVTGVSTLGVSTFTGDVSFGSNALFGDNDRAIFGGESDLQIYHSGASSFIEDTGTGNLVLIASRLDIQDTSGNELLLAEGGQYIKLNYGATERIRTSTTGVTVNGVVDAAEFDGDVIAGIATISTRLDLGTLNLGLGTATPQSPIHVSNVGLSSILVESGGQESVVTVARGLNTDQNSGTIRFGKQSATVPYSNDNSLDIINNDIGNLNFYLEGGTPGIGTGDFHWLRRRNFSRLMTLTYGGKLGIGLTNPTDTLHVDGTSYVTGSSVVGSNLVVNNNATVTGNLNVSGSFTPESIATNLTGNVNAQSGISTFNTLNVSDTITSAYVGIGTTVPNIPLSINEDSDKRFFVNTRGRIGVGTDYINDDIHLNVAGRAWMTAIGIGTTNPSSAVDFRYAGWDTDGTGGTGSFLLPPKVNLTERGQLTNLSEGAFIYNTTNNRLEVYSGSTLAWTAVGSGGGGGAGAMNDLSDVDTATTAPQNNQVLKWVAASSKWEPADDLSGGGSGSGFFKQVTNNNTIGIGTTANVSVGPTAISYSTLGAGVAGLTVHGGLAIADGVIEAPAGENKIPSLYANLAALPNAGTYHGMFAHVHSEGKGYFAHAGNWLELVNKDTSGNVSLGGDLDVVGNLEVGTGSTTYTNGLIVSKQGAEFQGVVTASSFSGETLKSRAYVHGTTGSLAVNATGGLSITGHKSYALLNVGVSTAAWVRLYTDSDSRGDDAGRSIGEDPSPGSGVIADIVTTGFSTSQVVSPGTIGFNNDASPSQTIYVSVKNMGIQTQPVTVNLQILQLESNS